MPARGHCRRTAALALTTSILLVAACGSDPVAQRIDARQRGLSGGPLPAGPTVAARSVPGAAASQPAFDPDAGMAAAIAWAVSHNPGLRVALERWRAAAWQEPVAGAMPDPQLTLTWFVEEIETRTGPQEAQLRFAQRFPWFGKRDARAAVARAAAEEAWLQVIAMRSKLAREVALAWLDHAELGGRLALVRTNLALLRRLEPVVREAMRTGAGQGDLLRLQVEIGVLTDQVARLESRLRPTAARLRALLALPPGFALSPPDPPDRSAPLPVAPDALAAALADGNPELARLRAAVETGARRIASARRAGYPDLTLGVSWFLTGEAAYADPPDSGEDPLALSLGIELPLWRDQYRAAVAQARAGRRGARAALRDRELQLMAEAEDLLFAAEDAERRRRLHVQTLIPRAEQALAVTRSSYRVGEASVLDLIDRERSLLALQEAELRARIARASAVAELRALLGGPQP